MAQINANIDDIILKEFRDVIYTRKGLKKGDFRDSLEESILNYILKYSKSETAKELAKIIKTRELERD